MKVCRSLAGHDRERLYLIEREDSTHFWLVDGRLRTLARPKKKLRQHCQILRECEEEADLSEDQAIAIYLKRMKEEIHVQRRYD